jgi:hypothetical protein
MDFNQYLIETFSSVDRLKRGFISKSQIKAYFPNKRESDRLLRREVLKLLVNEGNAYLDYLGFCRVVYYLISIGAYCIP